MFFDIQPEVDTCDQWRHHAFRHDTSDNWRSTSENFANWKRPDCF